MTNLVGIPGGTGLSGGGSPQIGGPTRGGMRNARPHARTRARASVTRAALPGFKTAAVTAERAAEIDAELAAGHHREALNLAVGRLQAVLKQVNNSDPERAARICRQIIPGILKWCEQIPGFIPEPDPEPEGGAHGA